MRTLKIPHAFSVGLILLLAIHSEGTLMAEDWLTFGHDAQRSGWTTETILSPENVSGLELKWASQLDNLPLALNALTEPLVMSDVPMPQGSKTVVYVAGSSDTFFALDAQDGKVLWNRTFDSAAKAESESFFLCPNAVNATPAIDRGKAVVYTIARDGKLYGLDLVTGKTKFGPFQFVPAFSKPWSLNFDDGVIYTSTSQGCGHDRSALYSMDVTDVMRPVIHQFSVRTGFGAGMWTRGGVVISENHRLFTSTGDANYDPAVGDFGSSFLAVSPRDFQLLDHYAPANNKEITRRDLDLSSGGLVAFSYKHQELIAGGGKESVIYLLRANSLGGKDHHSPLDATVPLANDEKALEQKGMWGAPAVWTDSKKNQTWLYVTVWGAASKNAPAFPLTNGDAPHGSIMAFNVTDDQKTHQPALQPAWISSDFSFPDPPVISNGVLFALSTGENPQQQHNQGITHFNSTAEWKQNLLTSEQRGQGTHPAVLYAMDAKTGKVLYQSGDAMKSWVHFSGLSISGGRIYAVDHDSRVYCFGLKSAKTE